jgi:hypothetical protein
MLSIVLRQAHRLRVIREKGTEGRILRSAGGSSGTPKSSAHTGALRFELVDKYYTDD